MTENAPARRRRLNNAFVVLADTLVTGFDLAEFLDRLLVACSEVLDCAGASLLLTDDDGRPQVMAASDQASRALGVLELVAGSGPGLDSFGSGSPVEAVRLDHSEPRWTAFAGAAQQRGFIAVQALPLSLRETTIGSVTFLHTHSPMSTPVDLATARALADVATIGILQQRLIHRGTQLAEQLQTALSSRLVIEQAKGLLAEHGGVGVDVAFDVLRTYCRSHRVPLSDTARALVFGEIDADRVMAHRSDR